MITTNVQAYSDVYGSFGTQDSFPLPGQIGLAASAVDNRIKPYTNYKRIKGLVTRLARLQVTELLLGRSNLSSYHELWRAELEALIDWSICASEAEVKRCLRETGWYKNISPKNIKLLLEAVPENETVKELMK